MNTPLAFVETFSERRGALVEPREVGAEILQPLELTAPLGLPEHGWYTEQPENGSVWIGYGSPVLEKLLDEATRQIPWAGLKLDLETPKESLARTAGERFIFRNAVHALEEVRSGTAPRLVVFARYSLLMDDRRDGLIEETVSIRSRRGVPGFWEAARGRGELKSVTPAHRMGLTEAARAALVRAEAKAREQSRSALEGFARRQERDQSRIQLYFDGLCLELSKRMRRSKVTAEDMALKEAAIERERASKLQELKDRGQVRFEMALAAALWVEAPVAMLSISARRRKAQRELVLEYDWATQQLVPPSCGVCGRDAPQPALCDEKLHVICSECVPRAEGRWGCLACGDC